MLIPRAITSSLLERLEPGRVVIVYGPRQVGKSTLLHEVVEKAGFQTLWLNGDEARVQDQFREVNLAPLQAVVGGYDLVVIDEAQKIPDIGLKLKIIVDAMKDLRLLVSGSSSFDLAHQIGEPLVGRKWTFTLYPIAQLEMVRAELADQWHLKGQLEEYLVYGSYPRVVQLTNAQRKMDYLKELVDGYLFNDILELDGLRNARRVRDICRLLAFQIGHEVSVSEIAQGVELSRNTVYRYLDMLEKAFVIRRVSGFSRNLRNEIRKNDRYYFWDNGVRNALIENLNSLALRNDVGQLFENFVAMERVKKLSYDLMYRNIYFWRTHDRQEIDIVEEGEGKLWGYEVAWKNRRKRIPSRWRQAYPEAMFLTVTQDNYLDIVT